MMNCLNQGILFLPHLLLVVIVFIGLAFLPLSSSSGPHHIPGSVTTPESEIQFSFYPPCTTPERPLRSSRWVELQILPVWPEGHTYTVIIGEEQTEVTRRIPYFPLPTFSFTSPLWWNGDGASEHPEVVEVVGPSSFGGSSDEIVRSSLVTIYWDFRYVGLDLTTSMIEESPGRITLQLDPDPASTVPIELMNETRQVWWVPRSFPSLSQQFTAKAQSNAREFQWIFRSCPDIIYWEIKARTGNWRQYLSNPSLGLVAKSHWVCMRCCDGPTCPPVDGTFVGDLYDVPDLPGNAQLRIRAFDVEIFENAIWTQHLAGLCPDDIDVILPLDVSIDPDWVQKWAYDIVPVSANSTHQTLNLLLQKAEWSFSNAHFEIAFDFSVWFASHGERVPFDIWLRIGPDPAAGTTRGDWQVVRITPVRLPTYPSIENRKPDTRFMNSAVWGDMRDYDSFETYASLGYNQVPMRKIFTKTDGYEASSNLVEEYSIQARQGPEWINNGLTFCPGVSLFHSDNVAFGVKSLFQEILEVSSSDPAYLDHLSPSQQTEELRKWNNAIAYHTATRQPDLGYYGYFLDAQIDLFRDVMSFWQPDCVQIDIEWWGDKDDYIADADLSVNLQERKIGSETNEEVVERVASELIGRIVAAIHAGRSDVRIVWYSLQSSTNLMYQTANYDQFDVYGIIPQPSTYHQQKNMGAYAEMIRTSRTYLVDPTVSSELVPTFAPSTYGLFDTKDTFALCLHNFCNGGTGVHLYGLHQIDNHDFYLGLQECLAIVYNHEDLLMDGQTGYSDFTYVGTDLVLGAMKLEDSVGNELLFAVTVKESYFYDRQSFEYDLSLRLRYSHADFRLTCERTGEDWTDRAVYSDGEIRLEFQLDELPSVFHVVSLRWRWAVVVGAVTGVFAVIGLVLAVVLILVIVICVCKKKKADAGGQGTSGMTRELSEDL